MINPFQDSYENRLKSWRDLRTQTKTLPLDQACVEIDRWWQQAPLVKNHIHWNDTQNWSGPWDLLSENTYCLLTRALGIVYTLVISDIKDVQLITATDRQCEEHYIVLVDCAKYAMNYWPNSVLSTSPIEFTINRVIPLDTIQHKIK